ncbi:olfactory receptor 7E24-like [Sciurus carolinensis]|uniref:olfactory receptor 7E24-like n=1 Tax=Sciurus carolinensis TaxID=30640 RepID=UPI001FB3EC16|nr:olfactory receptor 7E24-like [Sciurus carolinensis]
MYLVTMLGNLLIILAVSSDSHLHTPMYFFLSNLSFSDIGFISTVVPTMLTNIQTHSRIISYVGCLSQMSIFMLFVCMDSLLLTVMAYDRYVAICHPLHYPVIMNPRLCATLILMSLLISLLDSQIHNLIALQFTYFKDVEISSYFCHPSRVLNLACFDFFNRNIVIYFIGAVFGFLPVSAILLSYSQIFSSILKIPSSSGKHKAFSTCGSHLSVVCLFYGAGIVEYLGSVVSHSLKNSVVASVMYTVVSPMLNPFIYSLRNRDIQSALWRLHSRALLTQEPWHPRRTQGGK